MIRVARGEKLSFKQQDIPLRGWAMEARVYAEDPFRNFLPSIGYLNHYKEPTSEDGTVRVDAGIEEGGEIQIHYDPLISKLITYGKTRGDSINHLKKALDEYVIRGVNHNVSFLRDVLENQRYVTGDISTKFIPQEYPKGFHGHQLTQEESDQLIGSAAIIHFIKKATKSSIDGQLESFDSPTDLSLTISLGEKNFDVQVGLTNKQSEFFVKVNGKEMNIISDWMTDSLVFNGWCGDKQVTMQLISENTQGYSLQFIGTKYDIKVGTPLQAKLASLMPVKEKVDTHKFITSPMPGKIVTLNIKPGDKVVVGEGVVVIEAMKMRNVLRAERDGVIKKVNCAVGDSVAVDSVLVEFA